MVKTANFPSSELTNFFPSYLLIIFLHKPKPSPVHGYYELFCNHLKIQKSDFEISNQSNSIICKFYV